MIVGIAQIYLYTGLTATASDSYAAKKHLDGLGVTYQHLHYSDEVQHADVLSAITSWFPDEEAVTEFPFVVYDERHDDFSTKKVCLRGLAAIVESTAFEKAI